MESCLLDLAKNEVQSLVNLVKKEAQYLCCYNIHVKNFKQKKDILVAKHKDVKRKFQKGKGVFSFKFEAQQWEGEAEGIIHIDTKIKKKLFFGWCLNCWSLYRKGKELAEEAQHIEKLLERCNSNITEGRANVLDIKYLSSHDFLHFKSRESKFQDLLKALQDENCNMVELQGLGGTGKTSMAKEVHDKLKESKLIDKSIFLVVSQFPDFKKIRGEVAKSLYLNLDEEKEDELSSTILSRITNMDEKLLIILDDVWVKFDLEDKLGIPYGDQRKGWYATKIVKHCASLPLAIVALAKALKNKPISVWKDDLKTLEEGGLVRNVEKAYTCLKFSYDNLKSQKAKDLFVISSLFPEDSEIPIKLLIKIGIGLGSFNENDKYHLIRSEVHETIEELIHSSLLLNDEEEFVKMHDLVREVALWIGENDIQSLLDLEKPINGNLRYMCCKTNKIPDEIDGNKLEYLLIFLDDPGGFNVSDTFFKNMTSIKVLILANDERGPALSLTNSFQPLKSLQMLTLVSLEVGDISVLRNVLTLVTLWFLDCSIAELPKEFSKLKKLRSLNVHSCEIKKNNPFEAIEMCSQLEELTFVGNKCEEEEKDAISHNGSPLTLHRYCISSSEDDDSYYSEENGFSRCFRVDELSNLVSNATCKQLVERAEVLWLEKEDDQRMWNNLVPDIVPIDKEGVMNDLIVLHLSSRPNMKCLLHTKSHHPHVTAFCNLAELHLYEMGIEDLCWGPPPSEFLEQLEILRLRGCYKLKSILFNGNYNLCHLKSVELEHCPMLMSVFQPSTAPCLKKLEELTFKNCGALEYIIAGEDGDSNQNSYYDSLFPSLKELTLSGVPSFIGIVREYDQLSRHNSRNLNQSLATHAFSWVPGCCSLNKLRPASKEPNITISEDRSLDRTKPLKFDASIDRGAHSLPTQSLLLQSLKNEQHSSNQNQNDKLHVDLPALETLYINDAPKINSIFAKNCSMVNWIAIEKFDASIDRGAHSLPTQSLLLQSLKNVREIRLLECHNIISLSTLSIATSTIALEILTIRTCHKLKCITTHEGDAQVDRNYCAIFPTLEMLEIINCKELEFLFVSAISVGLEKLKSLTIEEVPKLKCVVGNNQKEQHSSNQNQNDKLHVDLPALETLYINDAPKINSIFAKNCSMVNWIATEEVHASTIEAPLFHRMWSIKCIVGDEGDARTQINYNSIFPKLKRLDVSYCGALEYLFPAYAFRSPVYLESLKIYKAPMLKYVFGRSQHDDSLNSENQNIQTLIDFPALKYLSIEDVPKLVSIYPENYYMRGLYLRSVILRELPEFKMKPFNEFLVCWHTEQQETKVIEMCWKTFDSLRYLFSITISDILPELFSLNIANASELEHVLIKRDEMEEIVMKDVLPQRCHLFLRNLPNLIGVCHGINFQKKDYYTQVSNCPNFDNSTTQHEADHETGNSQVEEKAEERLSSHMGEEITQQSFTKVVEARAESVSSNTLYQISLTSERVSTSLNQAPSSILSKSSDGVDHGDIKEAGMVQNENNLNVEPISLTRREQESSYSKGQIKTKDQLTDSQPMSAMPTTHFDIISQDEHSEIVEVKGEEGALILETPHPSSLTSKEEPIPVSLNSTSLSRSPSTTGRIFEEEEKGGLITTPKHESDTKAVSSLPPVKEHKTSNQGDPFVPPMTFISSEQQASDTILPLSFVPSNALTSPKQISMSTSSQSTYSGQLAECGSLEMASSICDTKDASSVAGVKEIVNMMKLEGFDKDWLESIKIKVFNCDASEFHHKQQVLKNLGNKLEANKRELANVRNQEAKATQSVEMAQKELEATHKELEAAYKGLEAAQSHLNVAQQEYANIRVHHSKLLEECQEILEQRDQCSEIIAAKLRPFGF
ncbi:hypothetical protein K1719_029945 [Acacia pycnantha]|nr:hypothetical protein K1719_029945 [Acacia pycnantha]